MRRFKQHLVHLAQQTAVQVSANAPGHAVQSSILQVLAAIDGHCTLSNVCAVAVEIRGTTDLARSRLQALFRC